ncbi:MAG TPA: helix-turn-helix transcriptional regulator [Trebonia sp.]|jgi:transcriptional regulator with XRE-family HTH domain|nr:helix-turn-helix transcriptional regulator [Trebonia sp.]
MDGDTRLAEFLRARRELAAPGDFGLPDAGRRRVRGLRREEVAMLAGVSTDYYVRLEQGRDRHPSEEIVLALGRVFGLDEDGLAHMRQLALPGQRRRKTASKPERAGQGLLRLLDQWADQPVFVASRFRDVLACTPLFAALHSGLASDHNLTRMLFLDPAERDLYPDWEQIARDSVAGLRAGAGADLDHPRLTELVGELVLKSDDFARLWARHDVRFRPPGIKRFRHPVVGEFTLSYETFSVTASPGQQLTVYHTEPGSPDADALALLASHAATTAAEAGAGSLGTPSRVIVFG